MWYESSLTLADLHSARQWCFHVQMLFHLGMSPKSSVHLSHPKVVQIPLTCQCCAIIWSDHKRASRSSYHYNKPTKQVCCSRTSSMDSGCTRAWPGWQDISCLLCSKISCSKIYWLLDQVNIRCASADHLVTASFVVILWWGQFQTWTGKLQTMVHKSFTGLWWRTRTSVWYCTLVECSLPSQGVARSTPYIFKVLHIVSLLCPWIHKLVTSP